MNDNPGQLFSDEMLQAVDLLVQPHRAWTILEAVANTHAPSQTVSYTRASTIDQLLRTMGQGNYLFDPNYARTGNALLHFGSREPRVLFVAHADEISYLVGPGSGDDSWSLIPYCSDQTTIDQVAIALRYQPAASQLDIVARGSIKRRFPGNFPYFYPTSGTVQPGDRLVYEQPIEYQDKLVRGSLDNAAGVTACLLAALALEQTVPDTPVAFAFTDEEEGPPIFNSAFARGSRRLARHLTPSELCVIVDGHDVSSECVIGNGAVFAEKSSEGKGAVVPPHLYSAFKTLAGTMTNNGVKIVENPGYVSRSDDAAWLEVTPNILLLGYPLSNPHFNQAVPAASLGDIINLAKAILWTALAFST